MRIERTGTVEKLMPRIVRFLSERLGGVSMDDVQSPNRERIDYSCMRGLLAVEVKTLEGSPSERIENFAEQLRSRDDFPVFYGSMKVDAIFKHMAGPEHLKKAALERLARPIVTHLKKANGQLAQHKADFVRPSRVGVVVLINEDHPEYSPEVVSWVVQHELRRKDTRGWRYPHVDAVLFLTERHGKVVENRLAMPVMSIHGHGVALDPWKEAVLDHVVCQWAQWNNHPLLDGKADTTQFESFDHVPESTTRHEQWRLAYRRNPHLNALSDDQLRDRFDEAVLISSLAMLKDAPLRPDREKNIQALEQFTHIQVEMNERGIPITKFRFESERFAAAAIRLGMPLAVIDWARTTRRT